MKLTRPECISKSIYSNGFGLVQFPLTLSISSHDHSWLNYSQDVPSWTKIGEKLPSTTVFTYFKEKGWMENSVGSKNRLLMDSTRHFIRSLISANQLEHLSRTHWDRKKRNVVRTLDLSPHQRMYLKRPDKSMKESLGWMWTLKNRQTCLYSIVQKSGTSVNLQ